MTKSASITEREREIFLQTYRRLPIEVGHAEGMYVQALDGRRYLDFLGGIAVNSAGHSHPRVINAIDRQLRRYAHVSNYFFQDAQIEFVERLCAMSGYARAFLSNSGAEANEGAIKFARAYGNAQGKKTIVGFDGGFHGRTMGVLSIMNKPLYRDGMEPFLPETAVLPFNDLQALRDGIDSRTCAVFIECLQGEGGVRWATPEFIAEICALRKRFGFLVVADEVQSGGGRTGSFLSIERFNFRPDIVTLAKGIGGGLPLGVMLVSEELASVWSSGRHGTTFGGNAVACAAGLAVLDLLAEGLMENARIVGGYMLASFHELMARYPSLIVDVRGGGAMVGMELHGPAEPLVECMLAHDVIINATADTVLRFLPPLIFQNEHVDMVCDALNHVLADHVP